MQALTLLETAIGFRLTPEVLTERCQVRNNIGRLTRKPLLNVLSVQAQIKRYEYSETLGPTDWMNIPLADVVIGEEAGAPALALPFTMFGGSYDEALVVYVAGFETLPDDLQNVLREIGTLLTGNRIDTDGWVALGRLSEESWSVIRKYKGVQ